MKKAGRGGLLWLNRNPTKDSWPEESAAADDEGSLLWSAAACRRFSFIHNASGGQPCQRLRQHQRPPRNVVWRGVLIRPVTVTIAAGNKEHTGRSDPRNKKRIVVSPAHHLKK